MIVTINNTLHPGVKSRDDLLELLQTVHEQYAEIWLDFNSNAEGELPAITLLKNGSQCWLMYLRYRGDSGWSTYQTQSLGNTPAISFELTNGDSYPTSANNCLDVKTGYWVLVHFLETNGERDRSVNWRSE